MSRLGVVVVLLALVVGAAFALTRDFGGEPGPIGVGASELRDPVAPTVVGTQAGELSNAAAPREVASTPRRVRAQKSSVQPAESDDGRLMVRVVRKADGAPVGGAKIRYVRGRPDWDSLSEAERDLRLSSAWSVDDLLRHSGEDTVADAEGVARLPRSAEDSPVVATHGGLYGRLQLDAASATSKGEWRVELEPDRTLRVLVVDAANRPVAGVPVALMVPLVGTAGPVGTIPAGSGETDAQGRLDLLHVQARGLALPVAKELTQEWKVVVDAPGLREVGHAFDRDDPPSGIVRLQLPPTGRVVVEVRDASGRAPKERAKVRLTGGAAAGFSVFRLGTARKRTDPDGRAVFPFVALGETFHAYAELQGRSVDKQVSGPVVAGARTVVTLVLDPNTPWLVGRAVDEEGQPLVGTRLQFTLTMQDSLQTSTDLVCDDAAGFRFAVPEYLARSEYASLCVTRRGESAQTVVVALSGKPQPGERRLGDVRLTAAPILVDGRFVGDDDTALREVMVNVQRHVAGSPTGREWRAESGLDVQRDGSRFVIRGRSLAERLRLEVLSGRHAAVQPIEFTPGQRGIEIELSRGGSARAVVLTDAAAGLLRLQVRLAPRGQAAPKSASNPVLEGLMGGRGYLSLGRQTAAEDGRTTYRWEGLNEGLYDLSVVVPGSANPVAEVRGVTVVAGEEVEDERLDAIDLRGRLRPVTIRIVDTKGELITTPTGILALRDAEGRIGPGDVLPMIGGVVKVAIESSLSAQVSAPGYPPVTLDGVVADTDVTLVSGPVVILRFDTAGVSLPVSGKILATLSPVGEDDKPAVTVLQRLASGRGGRWGAVIDGRARVRLTRAGRYSVGYNAMRAAPGDPVFRVEPAEITVPDSADEQTFEFKVLPGQAK